ncbi:MAG: 1-acyl-sn-glycerol-3-phosphate acyltransferase [Nitratiruptor sp.]|nr:1-acyl-sn-glycerol-3-phosphate acyltransferase [Nitratiruptor sp.]NPA84056.1 1-acyl-sn-glycerol-3-phosphate acyltransferase [Campylobacterota bacterium]
MSVAAKIRGLYAAAIIIPLVSLNILAFLLAPKGAYKRIKQIFTRTILKLLGIRLVVRGEYDPQAQMVLMNHSSFIDIPILEAIYPKDLVWVAKKELFEIPFFGLLLKLPDNIRLDRQDRKALVHLLKEAKAKSHGKTIAIFPEGTRGKGARLLPFKPGAKVIADRLGLRVQPILIVCARERFDSKALTLNPGTIEVIYLPSFEATPQREWLQELRSQMQQLLDQERPKHCPAR